MDEIINNIITANEESVRLVNETIRIIGRMQKQTEEYHARMRALWGEEHDCTASPEDGCPACPVQV